MPYLQIVKGKYRVRIVVPPELRPHLPPPHTGKANLTRALGTGNEREANRLAVAWIADFQAAITSAASISENPHGYDWISRYRAYHRGQNRFPPEAPLFTPHPALALPETQTKPVPLDRIILLWAKQTNAPKKGNQDMEAKCGRFAQSRMIRSKGTGFVCVSGNSSAGGGEKRHASGEDRFWPRW